MDMMSDDVLLQEVKRRFLDTKKALHDITIMKEKIEKLNHRLTESERLKSNFLSNIRNEINNPLASILGIAQELTKTATDEQTRERIAGMIYQEAFELDFQLKNIFIAAELEAGEARLNVAQLDAASLIRSVIGSFAHRAREKGVTIQFICAGEKADAKIPFRGDAEKLHRILANLLANAIEFNRPDKTVTIELRKEGKVLQVSIADEGIGIPEKDRERLFERFHQIDSGPRKKHRGHGLGLSITQALMAMFGGTLTFSEAPGGGCIFRIAVPETTEETDVLAEDGNEFLFDCGSTF